MCVGSLQRLHTSYLLCPRSINGEAVVHEQSKRLVAGGGVAGPRTCQHLVAYAVEERAAIFITLTKIILAIILVDKWSSSRTRTGNLPSGIADSLAFVIGNMLHGIDHIASRLQYQYLSNSSVKRIAHLILNCCARKLYRASIKLSIEAACVPDAVPENVAIRAISV
jgi:hypothetical protein